MRYLTKRVWIAAVVLITSATAAIVALQVHQPTGSRSSVAAARPVVVSSTSRTADETATRGSARTPAGTSGPSSPSVTDADTAPADQPDSAPPPPSNNVPAATTSTTAVPAADPAAPPAPSASLQYQSGGASYYDYLANGCAHKTLPKGTLVTVTNTSNGKSTTCVVNDRGPHVAGRIIDLDTGVFTKVASTSSGVFTAKISWDPQAPRVPLPKGSVA